MRPCRTATMCPAARASTSTSGADPLDPRRPDEHRVHRTVEPVERDVILERIHLAAKGVAPHRHIDRLERRGLAPGGAGVEDLGGQQDHPRTRPVGRHAVGQPRPQRFEQFELAQQMAHRGGLPAGDDQRVDGVEFPRPPHGRRLGARLAQRRQVFAGVALQRQTPTCGALTSAGVKSRW